VVQMAWKTKMFNTSVS